MRWWEYRTIDWPLIFAVLGATVLGLLCIASVDLSYGVGFVFLQRQLLSLVLGVGCLLILIKIPPAVLRATSRTWYFVALILLVAVLFFGSAIRGTRGWFNYRTFNFQPVEFAKIALLLVMARIIDRRGRIFKSGLFFFGTALVTFALVILVLVQPDLGSALVLVGLWILLVLYVGTKRGFILLLLGTTVAVATFGWLVFLRPYQKDRIISFIQPERDPLGSGYNVQQSIIAVGDGKFFGRGLGYGPQNQLSFLPERQTDFVFAVLGEELGFLGVTALFVCYLVIGWRLWRIIARARDDYTLILVFGTFSLWFIQATVNLGATVGVLPVTGITLPFVSYGGSSLIANFILLGIVESVASRQN